MHFLLTCLCLLITCCGAQSQPAKDQGLSQADGNVTKPNNDSSKPTGFLMTSRAARAYRQNSSTGAINCIRTKALQYNGALDYEVTTSCLGYEQDKMVTTSSQKSLSLEQQKKLDQNLSFLDLRILADSYSSESGGASTVDGETYSFTFHSGQPDKTIIVDVADSTSLPESLQSFYLNAQTL